MRTIEIAPGLTLYTEPVVHDGRPPREAERAAVQSIISSVYGAGTRILHNPDGAPFIPGSEHCISVSHCRTLAGVLVCNNGLRGGLDLETTDRGEQLHRVAPRFLSADELPYWAADPLRLLQAWTIKEAAFKAAGLPIADLREIHLTPDSTLVTARDTHLTIAALMFCSEDTFASIVIR